MASLLIPFVPCTTRVFAAKSSAAGGTKQEKGFLDWILGNLQKEDQFYETDPLLKKVEDKNGSARTSNGRRDSGSVPQKKKGSVFGRLFAKK
ncbi:hypothetical protein Goshw_008186 [Gossypium schwendimanii]|uniref:Thylakoid soluble phosphoprotein TSP9 n=1 Tax=Gossypium schwendimanii TaxID=34291 RepID=A0A7J9N5B7_GOSSC|nr:hypothetical protein [Gossypium schwendimanii]